MAVRTYVLLAVGLFLFQWVWFPSAYRRVAPRTADAAEVYNIAVGLAHGRGYMLDWSDPQFRRSYEPQNGQGRYDLILDRRGPPHATLSRPPLMPLLVAGCVWLRPDDVFFAWRVVDMALCAVAGAMLCGAAYAFAGRVAAVALIVVFAFDPIRWSYIPGWWTEGLAFDGVAVACWLLAVGKGLRPAAYLVAAGATVGLLCLDRAMFVLTLPALCPLLATVAGRRWLRAAGVIVAVSVAVQAPWWVRNIIVTGGRFVPLGTQGGFNLPDEYGPAAVRTRGVWDGLGMRDVWLPPPADGSDGPLPPPPGYTPATFDHLWTGNPRYAALIAAFYCTSTETELAVSDAGRRAAVAWVAGHPTRVPGLMLDKARSLTNDHRRPLAVAAIIAAAGYAVSPKRRRPLALMVGVAGTYWLAVSLTHVMETRFLIPVLPAVYVAVAVGVAAILRPRRRDFQ